MIHNSKFINHTSSRSSAELKGKPNASRRISPTLSQISALGLRTTSSAEFPNSAEKKKWEFVIPTAEKRSLATEGTQEFPPLKITMFCVAQE